MNSSYGLCGRKATLNNALEREERRSTPATGDGVVVEGGKGSRGGTVRQTDTKLMKCNRPSSVRSQHRVAGVQSVACMSKAATNEVYELCRTLTCPSVAMPSPLTPTSALPRKHTGSWPRVDTNTDRQRKLTLLIERSSRARGSRLPTLKLAERTNDVYNEGKK